MTKEEAVRKALDYVQASGLEVGPVVSVRYMDLNRLDEIAKDCPAEMLETYLSVRKTFRDNWVVAFAIIDKPGQVTSPSEKMISVFEDGEVSLVWSP